MGDHYFRPSPPPLYHGQQFHVSPQDGGSPQAVSSHVQSPGQPYSYSLQGTQHEGAGDPLRVPQRTAPSTSPMSISNFACTSTDMQIIESIINNSKSPSIVASQHQHHSCKYCGRVSLSAALNAIHQDESCPSNPASSFSKAAVQEQIKVDSSAIPPAPKIVKTLRTKRTAEGKKKRAKKSQNNNEELEGMISAIFPLPNKRRASKKTSAAVQPTPPVATQPSSPLLSPPSTISLWIPALSDTTQLASTLLSPLTPLRQFSLQRSRLHSLLLAGIKKPVSAFGEWMAEGLDHIIRSSLVGRRRLAAATGILQPPPLSSPPVQTLNTTPPPAPPPPPPRKRTRTSPPPRPVRQPASRLTSASTLSMPEI